MKNKTLILAGNANVVHRAFVKYPFRYTLQEQAKAGNFVTTMECDDWNTIASYTHAHAKKTFRVIDNSECYEPL